MASTASHQRFKNINDVNYDKGWSQFGLYRSMCNKTTIALIMHCCFIHQQNRCHRHLSLALCNIYWAIMPQDALSECCWTKPSIIITPDNDCTSHEAVLSDPRYDYEAMKMNFMKRVKPFVVADRSWSQTFIWESLSFCGTNSERQLKRNLSNSRWLFSHWISLISYVLWSYFCL